MMRAIVVISLMIFSGISDCIGQSPENVPVQAEQFLNQHNFQDDMNTNNDGAILFRNTMAYDTLNTEKFKEAIYSAVEFAQKNAPQLMVQVFIDEKLGLAYSFQLYRNSNDILKHWEISDENIGEVMKYCEVKKFEVYGNPSKEVIDGILGSVGSDKVSFIPELIGFYKFE